MGSMFREKPRVSLEGPAWKPDAKPSAEAKVVVDTSKPPPPQRAVSVNLDLARDLGEVSPIETTTMELGPVVMLDARSQQGAQAKPGEASRDTLWGVPYTRTKVAEQSRKEKAEPTEDEILRRYIGRERPTEKSTDSEKRSYQEKAQSILKGLETYKNVYGPVSKQDQDNLESELSVFREVVKNPVLDTEQRKIRDLSEIEIESRYKAIPKWDTETQIYYKNLRLKQKGYGDNKLLPRSDDPGDMILRTIRRVNSETGSPLAQWYYEQKGDHQTAENIREDIKMSRERDRLSALAQKSFWQGGALTGNWWAENSADALVKAVSKIGPTRTGIGAPLGLIRTYQDTYNDEIEKLKDDNKFPKQADKERVARERAKRNIAINFVRQLFTKNFTADSYGGADPKNGFEHVDQYREEVTKGAVDSALEGGTNDASKRFFEQKEKMPFDPTQFIKDRVEEAVKGGKDAAIDKLLKEDDPRKAKKK
jgi:hypothetical protein